jgi:hypothetical protein
MAGLGHEKRFRPPSLSDRCRLDEATFAETRGNGRDAPNAVILAARSPTWNGPKQAV